MSTHVPGFQSFSRVFASFCNAKISDQQHVLSNPSVYLKDKTFFPVHIRSYKTTGELFSHY